MMMYKLTEGTSYGKCWDITVLVIISTVWVFLWLPGLGHADPISVHLILVSYVARLLFTT
jgi:hypothetical protein